MFRRNHSQQMFFIACKWIAINDLARWSSSAILFLHLSSRPRSTQDPRELPLKKGNNRAKIVNNYSLTWRWILMDIYRAAKRTEQAPSTRIRIFLNPQLFFFRIRLPSTRIRRNRQRIRKKKIRSPEWKKYIRNESDNVWTGESGYFFIRWRKKRVQSLTEQ